ncbi:MAG: SIR2 family protein [Acidobacteria bacterium]|nr:SIR2 family protein [Acidobacteriota bacterium]
MSTEAISEEQFLREFTKELHSRNAAAFIGAGFSMSAGYVNWQELLEGVITDLGLDPKKEHDLVSVAQYSVNKAGGNKHGLTRTILHKIGIAREPTKGHRILANLPIHTFWTTNYDKLIETSLEEAKKVPDVKHTLDQLSTTRPDRDVIVYKMHGDVGDATNAVICKDDYERYPFKMGQFASLLKGDLIEKTFLFVGFSFTDPNIDFILSRVRAVLEDNQREHYCIQKKITKWPNEKKKDFKYRQLKQDYFIRDLKRKNIQTVEVATYDDIPLLLEKVATRFKRSSILISGAAAEFGAWKSNEADSFLYDLGQALSSAGNRIITGSGVGIGGAIINGALNQLDNAGVAVSEEHLMMRPFPHTASGKPAAKSRWTKYRKSMIEHAGIAIFVFGNKKVASGKTVDSNGMREEFDLCVASGVVPIPVGATGYMAERLWKEVDERFDHFFPNATASIRKSFAAIGKPSTTAAKLEENIQKIINHLQKD